jgi:hypothetical protein
LNNAVNNALKCCKLSRRGQGVRLLHMSLPAGKQLQELQLGAPYVLCSWKKIAKRGKH